MYAALIAMASNRGYRARTHLNGYSHLHARQFARLLHPGGELGFVERVMLVDVVGRISEA
jgi:hypothetical protein